MTENRQVTIEDLLNSHPVFTLDQACEVLRPDAVDSSTAAVRARLRYHIRTGRLRSISRGMYAVIPQGASADTFVPDPFLVARAARTDVIFSHHSALELLGAAHSAWSVCTAFTSSRRATLRIRGTTVRLYPHPTALVRRHKTELGTRMIERRAMMLRVTGPERSLVEGFRQPALVGGVMELVSSAAGFATLDMDLLRKVLECYALRRLWAAVGWFLEAHAQAFGVTSTELARFEQHRSNVPIYLVRSARGGALNARWNLVLPPDVGRGDPDAGES